MNISEVKNPRLLLTLFLPIPFLTAFIFFFGGSWLALYKATPFWAIFGSGMSIMAYYGGVAVVMWNRKVFKIRRNRVRITDKVKV